MTFKELLQQLPNGLHDTDVHVISIDFGQGMATFQAQVWIGESPATDQEAYDARRSARLTFTGLRYLVVEPPREIPPHDPAPLWIDAGLVADLEVPPAVKLPRVPPSAFVCWIYVNNWNAFIYLAADDVAFEWV
jgi:hypothetical protein